MKCIEDVEAMINTFGGRCMVLGLLIDLNIFWCNFDRFVNANNYLVKQIIFVLFQIPLILA